MDMNEDSLFGNVGEKFEAICLEVKSFGDNVKNFCSHAMDELLPLSSDDIMQYENPEWNLVYNFYMGNIREKPVIRKQLKSHCSNVNNSGSCNLSNLNESPSPVPPCFGDEAEEKFHLSEITVLQEMPIGHVATISSDQLGIGSGMQKQSDVETNLDINEEDEVEVSEQSCKIRLDESGLLADTAEHISTADLQGKPRSYKEKLQDVFRLRKRSSSKGSTILNQEQKPLHQHNKPSSLEISKILHSSSTSDSLESGWEIL